MAPDNHIVSGGKIFLMDGINVAVGIPPTELINGNMAFMTRWGKERPIRPRPFRMRPGEQYEDRVDESVSAQEGNFLSPLDFLSDFFLIFVLRAALMRLVLFRFFIASPCLSWRRQHGARTFQGRRNRPLHPVCFCCCLAAEYMKMPGICQS